ncbi:Kelch repeat-containing protein [Pseudomonadota bacterium]
MSSPWLMAADIQASPANEKRHQSERNQNQPEQVWVPGWRTGPLMQTPRSGAATVAIDGVIHVIGGVDGKNFLRTSEYIRVADQGALSEWSSGSALNTERGFFAAVRHKNFVYAVGGGQGDHGKILLDSVERAEIQPDGTLGEWSTEQFKLNTKRRCTKVAVIGNHLYAFGGFGGILLDSVERAEILPDGTLDEWAVLTDTMNVARYIHGVKKVRNRVYMVGGHDKEKGVGITDVEWSQEDSEGWLESWQFSKPLQTGRYGLATIQFGDYLYALGGLDGAAYLDSIEKAKIDEDGNLGAWEFTTPLLSQREGMSTLSLNNTVYIIGGTNLAGYKRSIEYAWFNEKGDIGYWTTAKEAEIAKAKLQKKRAQERVLPNEAVVLTHLKAARYSYLAVQRDDGLSAWLAGPVTELPVGARVQFPNGVVMRNFFSKELKRNFEVIMFVGELRIVKLQD